MKDAQTREQQINLRLKPSELEELDALARELSLDRSNTLRFLVREKTRALAATAAPAPPSAKKRRAVAS
jgi:hypothetical protein